MASGAEEFLDAMERGLPSIHSRLLSSENARHLIRRNIDEIRRSGPPGHRAEIAEQALTAALEELLSRRNPAADENRDQNEEDRLYEHVVEAFRAYAAAVRTSK